jgi:hypothetical protein
MTWTLLALSITAPPPAAADSPVAVTGLFYSRAVRWDGSYGTLWEGFALTLVGSSSAVTDLKAEDWKAAAEKNHVLVKFPKPHAIKGPGGGTEGKTYEATEILIRVADTGVIQGLWVRCGGTYYAFDKYNSALALFIEERHLPRPKK